MKLLPLLLLAGCMPFSDSIKDATDGTERGLLYVASAIVIAAIIRAFFNA